MASVLASRTTLRHLRDLFSGGTAVGLTDGQLLSRYAASNDGAAFAALVARHGPMVLSTCRAILRQEHDVEDAFQATFLVLARKARSVRAGDALGGWLHRVAYRVAVQANIEVQRRKRRESEVSAMEIADTTRRGLDLDLHSIVHEEIDRLPDRHRLPVVLCDLEGLSYDQAAARLDWTVPALRCRLAKARQRLRDRLSRRGVTGRGTRRRHRDSSNASSGGGPGSVGGVGGRGGDGRGQFDGGRRDLSDDPQGHAHDQAEDRRGSRAHGGWDRVGRDRRHRSGSVR